MRMLCIIVYIIKLIIQRGVVIHEILYSLNTYRPYQVISTHRTAFQFGQFIKTYQTYLVINRATCIFKFIVFNLTNIALLHLLFNYQRGLFQLWNQLIIVYIKVLIGIRIVIQYLLHKVIYLVLLHRKLELRHIQLRQYTLLINHHLINNCKHFIDIEMIRLWYR